MKKNMRFFRNILIGVIALIIVAFIVNIAPGYKRDRYANVINLIIYDENVTDKLINSLCLDNNNNVYISIDDVKKIFDSSIYYDSETDKVVMFSNTKVASMKINEKNMNLNGIKTDTLLPITRVQNIIYLPLQELDEMYNIEINYSGNKVIVDSLEKSIVSADIADDVVLKFKPRALSKDVIELQKGQEVYCFYTTSKGWRLIRTKDGILGYVKANKLANEYVLRQDMDEKQDAKLIQICLNDGNIFDLNNKKIIVRDMPKLTSQNLEISEYDVWLNIKNDVSENEMNDIFNNFEKRTNYINNIVNYAIKLQVKAINIDMSEIKINENFTKFLMELAPRLRDFGILTNVVKTNELNQDLIKQKIDYIIEKE